MAEKLQNILELAQQMTVGLGQDSTSWKHYLECAGRFYKYPFHEQILIYGQRPDATACAPINIWNRRMGRWVNKYARGIALLDDSGSKTRLKYVFDISDTHAGRYHPKRPFIWSMKEEYQDEVITGIYEKMAIPYSQETMDFSDALLLACQVYTRDNDGAYLQELEQLDSGSLLFALSVDERKTIFSEMLDISVAYTVFSRCGLSVEKYLSETAWDSLLLFSDFDTISVLGCAVSDISGMVLREIGRTISSIERQAFFAKQKETRYIENKESEMKQNKEEQYHDDKRDIQADRRLSVSQSDNSGSTSSTDWQIRQDEKTVSEEEPESTVQPASAFRETGGASAGNRTDREQSYGTDDAGYDAGREYQREDEGRKSDEMGGDGEQYPESNRGNSSAGTDLQLEYKETVAEDVTDTLPLFFMEPERERLSKAVDYLLQTGSHELDSVYRICGQFRKQKPAEENIAFLKSLYGTDGKGFQVDGVPVSVWYNKNGIYLSEGKSVRGNADRVYLSWGQAENRIQELLRDGMYLPGEMLQSVEFYERKRIANQLYFLLRDINRRQPAELYKKEFGFPEAELFYMEQLQKPEQIAQYRMFLESVKERYPKYAITSMIHELQDLEGELLDYHAQPGFKLPDIPMFLTDDYIDKELCRGGQTYQGKYRIFEYFQSEADAKKREAFLRNEYGTGGRASGGREEWHDAKGLILSQKTDYAISPYDKVTLNWSQVEKRVASLIQNEQYLQQSEMEGYQQYLQEKYTEAETVLLEPDIKEVPPVRELPEGTVVYYESRQYEIREFRDDTVILYDFTAPLFHVEISRTDYEEKVWNNPFNKNMTWMKQEEEVEEILPVEEVLSEDDYISENVPQITEAQEKINFQIRDETLGHGSAKEKYQRNISAIKLLQKLEQEERYATAEEQEILSKYVGWGGLAMVFEENNTQWQGEYQELKALLTENEYHAARASTLTAFYTSPEIIRALYQVIENIGFRKGNILEPSCGIGNFFGLLPESMKESSLYGVELDSITGRIARQLYQNANITIGGYEETTYPDNVFDVVIGNVPFGQYQVSDKRYDRLKFSIHDYFFAKALDQVRPGGVIAFITSSFTMDKQNPSVRKYIAQRAELLGAMRLPNTAFKANAGTEAVTDILFLQKRERAIEIEPDWVYLAEHANGFVTNQYFAEHPEMILGTLSMETVQYGREACVCLPKENENLSSLLEKAVINIHGSYQETELYDFSLEEEEDSIPADPNVRNFSYAAVAGKLYYRENSRMYPVQVSITAQARITGMIEIRDCVRTLISLQTEDASQTEITAKQQELNMLYDRFIEKYGLLNSRANAAVFRDDSAYPLLCSLEHLDENGNLKRKADMFYKQTIQPYRPVTHVETAREALAVSLSEKACVDILFMTSLLENRQNAEEIIGELQGIIYKDPLSNEDILDGWQTADEYLSGNVREKLKIARLKAEQNPEYQINVKALEQVQPEELKAADISVQLGTTWIPVEIVQQFMYETFQTSMRVRKDIRLLFLPVSSEWQITHKTWDRGNVQVHSIYGTARANAYRILEDTLNLRDVRVYDYIDTVDGKRKAVLNQKETVIAQGKQELLKQTFQDWIWKEPERRNQLEQLYNERFNSIRVREYDGSHLTFPGMNPEITLRPHQLNAIARILYGGNTLLAHVVGAGKTFEMVAAAQESKRLGLCSKSLFVVPNHLIEQWASEYLQLYPSANILVAYKKDFERENRKKFCSRIATGQYDAIIMGHSQFEKIPMSIEHQQQFIQSQIDDVLEGIQVLKENEGERFQIKAMERTRKKLEKKLEQLLDDTKKDTVITFEELGIDRIFVDEAHYYKNLAVYTKMRNVAGISQTEAQKSSDMFMKCRYLDGVTGGKGVIFATGTPISNSMVELYTMQRYLQYHELERQNLTHFDCWASVFGETVTAIELAPEGTSYRAKTRFAKFHNLPELMSMFREVADIQTADMLNLPVPKANYVTIAVEPSEIQKEIVAELAERAEAVRDRRVRPDEDNMLKITNDGRKLALDQRLINSLLPDDAGSKVSVCADHVFQIWERTAEQSLTQLVFCDLSTPSGGKKQEADSEVFQNVYEDLRQKLLEKGIPIEQMAFIHEADTDGKKKELFAKVRQGTVRVLIGSTQKMGAGTNVQDRLIVTHDLDCPWRPSDLEQRGGRIIRQGNQNQEVYILRYVTKGTFDAYLYQTVENKQKFISQIMTGKLTVRSAEDIDAAALSYAEVKMLATDNPLIKEKMELDVSVSKLRLLKSSHMNQKYQLEDQIIKFYPQELERLQKQIYAMEKDKAVLQNNRVENTEEFPTMVVHGKAYEKRSEAGLAILSACRNASGMNNEAIGYYRGFQMILFFDSYKREHLLTLKNQYTYTVELGTDALGNIRRIDNKLEAIPEQLEQVKEKLIHTKQQFQNAKEQVTVEFPYEEELREKQARLDEVDSLLNLNQKEEAVLLEDDEVLEVPSEKKRAIMER